MCALTADSANHSTQYRGLFLCSPRRNRVLRVADPAGTAAGAERRELDLSEPVPAGRTQSDIVSVAMADLRNASAFAHRPNVGPEARVGTL